MLIKNQSQAGLSVIEIIIAVSLFIIMAAATMSVILGSFSTSRLGLENNRANFLVREGAEAVESIRNRDWGQLSNGTHGLSLSGSLWTFSGSSDVDNSGKYTRTITIEDALRDGSGNLVESGGTTDSNTKKITISVNWDFTPTRNNTVTKILYLSDWQTSTNNVGSGAPPVIPSPSPSPSPTASPTSCTQVCQNLAYLTGTCRKNPASCNQNGETRETQGDIFCTGGQSADTCCCAF